MAPPRPPPSDSSDAEDEFPKLSALTNALLNGPTTVPAPPPSATITSRYTRQPHKTEPSPAPRGAQQQPDGETPRYLRTVRIPVVKRTVPPTGSLLSGPARRVGRRQMDEEGTTPPSDAPNSEERHHVFAPTSEERYHIPAPASDERHRVLAPPSAHASSDAPPSHERERRNVLGPIAHNAAVSRSRANGSPPPPPPKMSFADAPPKMSFVEAATAAAGASTSAPPNKKKQVMFKVNGRVFTKIDCIGRGGSGKVYRVAAESGKMLALKRASLDGVDPSIVKGFEGEIELLRKLAGVDRVIQLVDYELNFGKKMLSILMEIGELDVNTFLRSRPTEPVGDRDEAVFDPVFVRYWWKEMLECVKAIHEKDIVHSDLKPANFVLVQGRLKLIDFGIANAIQTDRTVNVHRESQIGTPNFMSPESLMDATQYAFTSASNGQYSAAQPPPFQRGAVKLMKLGKPSDVWSLGCILYQLVYGQPPFNHIRDTRSRCHAIINWDHEIEFPKLTQHGIRVPPSLARTMRRCLNRDQTLRPTCEELLDKTDPFLYPVEM